MKSKQIKNNRKRVKEINTAKPLDLLHMDLMGSMYTKSKSGKRYVLVAVDDYSKYSFVCFFSEKAETIEHLKPLCTRIQVEINHQL